MKKKTLLYAIALLLVASVSLASVLPMQKGKADRSDWMAVAREPTASVGIFAIGEYPGS